MNAPLGFEAGTGNPDPNALNISGGITPEGISANADLIHQILAGLQARYNINASVVPGQKTNIEISPKLSLEHDQGPLHAEISKQMGMKPRARVDYGSGDLHAFLEKQLGVPATAGIDYSKQLGGGNLSAYLAKQRGSPAQAGINYTKQF